MSEILDVDQPVQLPFSERKQSAVLGHLLTDPKFFSKSRHRIEPSWFQDPVVGKVYAAQLRFYREHGRPPSYTELVEQGDFVTEDPATRESMRRRAGMARVEIANFGLDAVSKELQDWYQAFLFRKAAASAQKLFNNKQFTECYSSVQLAMTEIRSSRFIDDGEYDFSNLEEEIKQEELDRDNACTLGSTLLDRTLLPDGTAGSLLPADQTILLAATNTGKTRALITIARANAMKKKSVLWLAHEGRSNDLAMLLRCSMLQCTKPELFKMMTTEKGRQNIAYAQGIIEKYITFIPHMKAGMTIEDVEPIIRNKCEERASKTGKTYDLFVSDYPAKLTTKQAAGGHMAPRHILDLVYNYHVNLALEYRYHSLVAYQTNREGAKAQHGKFGKEDEDSRLLVMEDASEAYGPMQTATNVLTMNRPPSFVTRGYVTYNFCKSRSGETGWAVCCKSDYARMRLHSDKLGGVKYRGTAAQVEQMDSYMAQYFNGAVPLEVLAG